MRKNCYKMKMKQIGVNGTNNYQDEYYESETQINNPKYVRQKSYLGSTKQVGVEHVEKCVQVRCINNDAAQIFALQMTVRERTETRKISFSGSSGYSSARPSEGFIAGKLENRLQYLQKKYVSKWRIFVARKIITRATAEEYSIRRRGMSRRLQSSKKFTFEGEKITGPTRPHSREKITEQLNTATELELARLKLEEKQFSRDVQGMLKESMRPTTKVILRPKAPNQLSKNDEKKRHASELKVGWDMVTRMELRAQERLQRREDIRERKRQLEIERAERIRIEEEKRKQMEDEDKKRRILKIKHEIKRRVIQRKIQEEERIRLSNLNLKADEHYKTYLLKSSLTSFVRHLEQCRMSLAHAKNCYNTKLLTESLVALNLFRRIEITKKCEIASEFHETTMLRRAFDAFKKVRANYLYTVEKSEESNNFRLMRNCFFKWFLHYMDQKCKYFEREEFAARHYERSLMKRSFQNWQQLPLIHFQEREKELRFRSWCTKIQELLPDFQPPE